MKGRLKPSFDGHNHIRYLAGAGKVVLRTQRGNGYGGSIEKQGVQDPCLKQLPMYSETVILALGFYFSQCAIQQIR